MKTLCLYYRKNCINFSASIYLSCFFRFFGKLCVWFRRFSLFSLLLITNISFEFVLFFCFIFYVLDVCFVVFYIWLYKFSNFFIFLFIFIYRCCSHIRVPRETENSDVLQSTFMRSILCRNVGIENRRSSKRQLRSFWSNKQ